MKRAFFYDKSKYYTGKVLKIRFKLLHSRLKILKILLKIRYNRYLFKCQSFLPLSESISNNIIFPHGLSGIFISSGATLGDDCIIFQQVTIGSNTLSDSKNAGFPIIGNKCYIGAGSKIIGNVKIGDNVRIGANVTITKDIPSNCTVVNSPFRIIMHKKQKNNAFIQIDNYKGKDMIDK